MSAADGCTQSLGGMKTPGALVVARVPGVIVPGVSVPVCVVSRCVYTSVWKCVLRRTHTGSVRACLKEPSCVDEFPCATPCASVPSCVVETPRMDEPPGTSEAPCASGVFTSVPACVLPDTPCVKGAPQGEETTCARETARV